MSFARATVIECGRAHASYDPVDYLRLSSIPLSPRRPFIVPPLALRRGFRLSRAFSSPADVEPRVLRVRGWPPHHRPRRDRPLAAYATKSRHGR